MTDGSPLDPRSRPSLRGTFSRNTLTSTFTIALDFFTLTGLVELVHVDYVLATWIGAVVGSLSNFSINRWWSFRASWQPRSGQFSRFVLVQVGASGLHTAGVWLFTRFLGLPYPVSKLVVAALVYVAWNFPMNHWVVFSPRFAGTDRGGEPSAREASWFFTRTRHQRLPWSAGLALDWITRLIRRRG